MNFRIAALAAPVAFASLLSGCGAPVQIELIEEKEWFARHGRSVLDTDEPSEWTTQFLRREALMPAWEDDAAKLLVQLEQRLLARQERAIALVIAELAFLEARHHRGDTVEEPRFLFTCAEHAWAALFDAELGEPMNGYDPGFRFACDLYNRSVAWILRFAAVHRPGAKGQWTWAVIEGQLVLRIEHSDYSWDPRDYQEIAITYDLEVTGLPVSARGFGLGVPTIVVRAPTGDQAGLELIERIYGATVVLRFDGSILERARSAERKASFEVYDPLFTSTIEIAGQTVPIEEDLSTTLAYTLTQEEEVSGLAALFDAEEHTAITRLMMLEPWRPKKIPVVFVHGLMSSPMTWMPMLNDLFADPVLRERYQFWFFRYSTGNPVLYSGKLLRAALLANQREFDPDATNPCMQEMVMIGHSMGGLLSRVQVNTSGDRLWNVISETPFEEFCRQVGLSDEEAAAYRDSLFFERLPFVKRLVLMASPLHGAELAEHWLVRIITGLISLPETVGSALTTSAKKGARLFRVSKDDGESLSEQVEAATGVGGLEAENPVQKTIAAWNFPADLPIHTIIGNEDGTEAGGSDGLVDYTSSHVDGVESEKIIHWGHNVQTTPEAVVEIRRILMLHLEQFDRAHGAKGAASGGAQDGAAKDGGAKDGS